MKNLVDELRLYFDRTSPYKILEDCNKSKEYDEIGPTIDEFIVMNKEIQSKL